MSGHSKWATTKRAKAVTDAKRSNLFTKLARGITVAAREKGGDPEANFGLRLAIEKARAANMPKENIERSIKRGTGEIKGAAAIEELIYEGFGPGGTTIIIKCLSDNKNRTASQIKHILTSHGGSLGSPNSVLWQFEQKGVTRIDKEKLAGKNPDDLELQIIDLGAQDIVKEDDSWVIYTKLEDLQKVSTKLKEIGLEIDYAEIEYVPKEKINLSEELQKKNQALYDDLDDDEDVDNYYTNLV
ncbi:MAG: YebC/PmpR family DNA-binding transcriptional regulator [Candidatus Parcubacteria bacterium]|nr:YebC/PmpR family DNA-binding transcriptional regulator [Candidatus Parcubacteria bacterium]